MAPVYTCTEWQWAVSSVGELTTSKTLLSRFGIPVESMNHLVDLWLDARTSFLLQVNWLDNHLKGGQFSGFPAFRPFATALQDYAALCAILMAAGAPPSTTKLTTKLSDLYLHVLATLIHIPLGWTHRCMLISLSKKVINVSVFQMWGWEFEHLVHWKYQNRARLGL